MVVYLIEIDFLPDLKSVSARARQDFVENNPSANLRTHTFLGNAGESIIALILCNRKLLF